MARTALLVVLLISSLLELALTVGAFAYPVFTLAQFGVKYGPETFFLAYIVAWFLLFVSLVAGVADILIGLRTSFTLPAVGCGNSKATSRAFTWGLAKTSLTSLIGPQGTPTASRSAIH